MYRVPDLGGRTNAQAQPASGQAFDEGAEMSTITINAWERHRAACEKGYPLFADRKDIGSTHGIRMKDPVYCTMVNGAHADIVLGLSFGSNYDATFPAGFKTSQGFGVTCVSLGVPQGHALFFPKPLRERFSTRTPPQAAFRQMLRLDTSCLTWYVAGKGLTPP